MNDMPKSLRDRVDSEIDRQRNEAAPHNLRKVLLLIAEEVDFLRQKVDALYLTLE